MSGASPPPRAPESVRRQLDLAAAVARERVLDAHLRLLLELVERAREEVPPPRALEIYVRLHRIAPGDALILSHRLLVALGRRIGQERLDIAPPADGKEPPWDSPSSLLGRLRKRLRGRVNPELRRWVELHTGRAEIALLEVHVENALRVIEILEPMDSYAAAVELYAGLLHVPPPQVETLYFLVLDRLSRPARRPEKGEPATPHEKRPVSRTRPLRIIENSG